MNALVGQKDEGDVETALESVTLDLGWVAADEAEVAGAVRQVFEGCKGVGCIEINKRVWRRIDNDEETCPASR